MWGSSPSGSKKCGKMPSQYLACTQPLFTALSSCVCLAAKGGGGLSASRAAGILGVQTRERRRTHEDPMPDLMWIQAAASPAMAHPNPASELAAATTARVHRRTACLKAYTGMVDARTTSAPSRRSAAGAPPQTPMGAASSPSRASASQRSPNGRVRTHVRVPPVPPSSLRSPCRPRALSVSARRAERRLRRSSAPPRCQQGTRPGCMSRAARLLAACTRLVPTRRQF